MSQTPGYMYGDRKLVQSPVSLEDLAKLKATLLWSDKDHALLKRAGEVLIPRADRVLDVWYGFVGSLDHLLVSFSDHQGNPNADYLAAVRRRFAVWKPICVRANTTRNGSTTRTKLPFGTPRPRKTKLTESTQPMRFISATLWPLSFR